MSKRNSVGSKNTLFNYFSKTPPANKKAKLQNGDTDGSPKLDSTLHNETDSKNDNKKRERHTTPSPKVYNYSDSEDEVPIAPKRRKRIRLNPIDSDDSDTENKDNKVSSVKEKISVEKKLHDSFKYEANQTPKNKKSTSDGPKPTTTKFEHVEKDTAPIADVGNWVHCKLEWLKPDKIRDAQKRRPDHADYDPTTLYVPPDFYNNQTPAHRQWWEMKSSHFDCVLFFKVGKFYELYHMDAAVGVNELGFSYMKGDFAHSGFPESAYARMASTLVSKGYKVARVEQTETPDMMQERCKKLRQSSKWDKVVRREICQVTLRGTQVCGLQDPGPGEASAAYMLAITEEEGQGSSTYGVCFVDTSIGLFHLGQFKDDKHSSRLLTTLSHYPPALIVYERKSTTARTCKLLSTHCHGARREARTMPPPEKTLKTLAEQYYKTNADGDWPEGLKQFLHEGDALGLTPAANCFLAVKALGGCVTYLTECLLDVQVLGMSQFASYEPPDVASSQSSQSQGDKPAKWEGGSVMVLDAITLRNLRIVQDVGCLYDKLNYCSTAMGKRLLYQWVCAPSCNLNVIKERQEAVRVLFDQQELTQNVKNILTTLPDLERLLAKVHSLGNLLKSKTHPDSRAIFYEEKIYSKRKVLDFISVLNGFTAALGVSEMFTDTDSALLKTITQFSPEGKYPDYRETLKFFKDGFDQTEAEKAGVILPGEGMDPEYDDTLRTIKEIDDELKEYLAEQEKYFRCRLAYVGSDKKRYQIEVPVSAASKAGADYQLEGTRKGYKKFSTAETREFLARMIAAEEQKRVVLKDLSRRIFENFSSHYAQWEAAVQCIATLDILLAFAEFARQQSTDVCLPIVTMGDSKPYINITEGRHPCIPIVNDFVPNDAELGTRGPSLLLLTGPNMGGKSTLMRQVGLLVVLAQLGSYVPAQACSLSVVDRIFTRLGASDDILSGQSTFLVEMNETAAIVKHATQHSLVLLDELGRGTSTYDGTAIASGVCAELAARGCRVVFSTHYHSLVHHFATHPGVILGHMACMVETDESTPDSEDHIPEETITFLYKLTPGACPKSYGFNAARLAGVSKHITRRAHQISKRLEKEATCVRAFRDILKMETKGKDIRELLAALCI
ncbi:probable DNA mismatch repair protein Msh6 isoform X2 [Pectinophora gossypiella]|uniref:probable DNA mismatch repair protein Msh6 isoform X2 n=1 Tax=Pectinophora gossypiella TaxID=13191 RepID=UPI00214F388A|nr:probable DNA mismatch repair protein Msh6 isoform X2 [Pectinophora gossypiella]